MKLYFYKCAVFYYFDFYPLFEFIISIAILCHYMLYYCYFILEFLPWLLALPPWFPIFFAFSLRFPAFPCWFPTPAFPSHSSHSHPYSMHFPYSISQFPIVPLTDSLLSLENSCFSSKTNTPLSYYCITLDTKLSFTSSRTISVLLTKIVYLIVPHVKTVICNVWVNNSKWLKCYLNFMSKWATICSKLPFFLFFFSNLCQFTKIT